MIRRLKFVRLDCDICREAESPLAPNRATAIVAARAIGWKAHSGSGSVKQRHVCPDCFATLLAKCGDDRAARAELAYKGESGETRTELAKLWSVTTQSPLKCIASRPVIGELLQYNYPSTGIAGSHDGGST